MGSRLLTEGDANLLAREKCRVRPPPSGGDREVTALEAASLS